jgi:hypothetical protein
MIMLFARKLPAIPLFDHRRPCLFPGQLSTRAVHAAVGNPLSECDLKHAGGLTGLHALYPMTRRNSAFVSARCQLNLDLSKRPWTS